VVLMAALRLATKVLEHETGCMKGTRGSTAHCHMHRMQGCLVHGPSSVPSENCLGACY
jgi:hypothetical protein